MKASVPKLFFCPGSASYTPVTQGSRWRIASRQLRKPTTPSALAFFVVDRAPSGFPFGCAVQNPITPFAQTLPTRPLFPQNTAPQTLSPTALTHCSHAPKHSSLAAGKSQDKAFHPQKKLGLPQRKGKSVAAKAHASRSKGQFRRMAGHKAEARRGEARKWMLGAEQRQFRGRSKEARARARQFSAGKAPKRREGRRGEQGKLGAKTENQPASPRDPQPAPESQQLLGRFPPVCCRDGAAAMPR